MFSVVSNTLSIPLRPGLYVSTLTYFRNTLSIPLRPDLYVSTLTYFRISDTCIVPAQGESSRNFQY
jgi:hypothetical protein